MVCLKFILTPAQRIIPDLVLSHFIRIVLEFSLSSDAYLVIGRIQSESSVQYYHIKSENVSHMNPIHRLVRRVSQYTNYMSTSNNAVLASYHNFHRMC